MKRLLFLFILFGLACSTTNLVISATATPVSAVPTVLPPTATFTITPLPTATFQPTNTPQPPAILPENVAKLVLLKEINAVSLRKVVFSPDGTIFAAASGNDADFGVTIWSNPGGKQLFTFPTYTGIVWDLAFSPDGKWIATAADDTGNSHVRILDPVSGKQILALAGPKISCSVAFSPDGTKLAVGGINAGSQGVIWVYDTSSWQPIQTLKAPGQNVLALVFSHDGSQLISSGTDGKMRLWKLATGSEVKEMFRGREMNHLALSQDGSLLASSYCDISGTNGCTRGGVVVWRTADWGVIQQFDDLAEGLVFTPDGSLLLTGSGVNNPQVRFRLVSDWSIKGIIPTQAYGVAISPDGRTLAAMTFDKISLYGLK